MSRPGFRNRKPGRFVLCQYVWILEKLKNFSIRIDVIQNSFDEWIILLLENDFLLREIRKHDIINNMKMQYIVYVGGMNAYFQLND